MKALPLLLFMSFASTGCNSSANPTEPAIHYTKISDCNETVSNQNAAFSELDCGKISDYNISITQQSPIYFTVTLKNKNKNVSSEFEDLAKELPLNPGPALEWHTLNGEPKFLIFRIGWGSEDTPFEFTEYLTLNYVAENRICALALVASKENPSANEAIRKILTSEFLGATTCPEKIMEL